MHVEIQVDKDYTFSWPFYDRAGQIVPTSATVNIYDKAGSTVVSASGSISTAGTITYTFAEADNDTEGINFKVVLDYVYAGETIRVVNLFDVVKYPLQNLVTEDDLFTYVPELRDKVFELNSFTTSAGTTTTLIDTRLTTENRQYKGGRVEIYIDSTLHEAKVSNYASATGTITFTPAYTSVIASGTKYCLRDSYQDTIDVAYNNFVHRDVRNRVGISAGYIDSNVINNLVVFKALELLSMGAIETEGDKWALRYNAFKTKYDEELAAMAEPFDSDGDGNITDEEDSERPNFWNVDVTR